MKDAGSSLWMVLSVLATALAAISIWQLRQMSVRVSDIEKRVEQAERTLVTHDAVSEMIQSHVQERHQARIQLAK